MLNIKNLTFKNIHFNINKYFCSYMGATTSKDELELKILSYEKILQIQKFTIHEIKNAINQNDNFLIFYRLFSF